MPRNDYDAVEHLSLITVMTVETAEQGRSRTRLHINSPPPSFISFSPRQGTRLSDLLHKFPRFLLSFSTALLKIFKIHLRKYFTGTLREIPGIFQDRCIVWIFLLKNKSIIQTENNLLSMEPSRKRVRKKVIKICEFFFIRLILY